MSIDLTCPACGAHNAFTDDQSGRLGKCGQCQTPVYVPSPEEMPSGAPTARGAGVKLARIDKYLLVAAVLAGIFIGAFGNYFLSLARTTGGAAKYLSPAGDFAGARFIEIHSFIPITIRGELAANQEAAYFRFNAPRTGTVNVDLTVDWRSSLDAELHAYDQYKNSHGIGAGGRSMSLSVSEGVACYVEVAPRRSAYGNQRTGSFTLTFTMR